MNLQILILDDNLNTVTKPIRDALKPFLAQDKPIPELGRGETIGPVPLKIGTREIDATIICNTESDPVLVVKEIKDILNKNFFDLVLLDDAWGVDSFDGQDKLLPVVFEEIRGNSPELPTIALFTKHWDDDARISKFIDLKNKGKFWGVNRIVGFHKNDVAALRLLFQSLVAQKSLIEDKERAEVKAKQERRLRQGIPLHAHLPEELSLSRPLIGKSEIMREVFFLIEKAAAAERPVLISGETGVGKEVVARSIHELGKGKKQKPFVAVNCPGIPENLLESEMFGHEKGAFTGADRRKIGAFETADDGVLFLDEVADLPLNLQSKLLRVLEEFEFNRVGGTELIKVKVQVIAATSRDLASASTERKFREDLLYRLNVLSISVPPLRDRPEDIPLLLQYYLKKIAEREDYSWPEDTLNFLIRWSWPGNIRTLRNFIDKASTFGHFDGMIDIETAKALLQSSTFSSNAFNKTGPVIPQWLDKERAGSAIKYVLDPGEQAALHNVGRKLTRQMIGDEIGTTDKNIIGHLKNYHKEISDLLKENPTLWSNVRSYLEEWLPRYH